MLRCDDACRDYMYDFIKNICLKIGTRSSATPKEHEGLKMIEEELKIFSDEIFRDDFECHPGSYPRGFVHLLLIIMTISYVMYLFSPILTLIILGVGILLVFLEFFLLKEVTDWMYRKKKSWNVFGRIRPTKETRKLVILGGHADSAYELRWFKRFRSKIVRFTFGAIGAIAVLPVLTVIKMIGRGLSLNYATTIVSYGIFSWAPIDWFYFLALGCSIYAYIVFGGYFTGKLVHGANDNLSGVAVSLAVGKYLAKNRPQYVETWVGSFGAEECGQRGSKAFVKAHGHEIQNSYTLIPESVGTGDIIAILDKEEMCFTTHSEPLVEEIEKVAKSLLIGEIFKGKKFTPGVRGSLPWADTDAMRFSEKGFEAMAFLGITKEDHYPRIYHDVLDTYTCINKKLIGDLVEIILQFIENLDNNLK